MGPCLANGIAYVLSMVMNLVTIVIIASIIVSFIGDPYNQLVQMVNRVAEPIYKPFRGISSKIPGPLDFTPIFVFAVVIFLQKSVIAYLFRMGAGCAGPL